ncbi:MAG: hypothetical protein Tsb005_13630 [Gammaproteobacteria bacterium]
MKAIIRLFWQVCLLRLGPQDLPYSTTLFSLIILGYVGVNLAQGTFYQPLTSAIWQTCILLSVDLLFLAVVLYLRTKIARYIQTACAILGVNTLINVLILPVALIHVTFIAQINNELALFALGMLFLILVLGINIWLIVINSHIFRHALDVPFAGGLFVALALMASDFLAYYLFIAENMTT